MIFLHLFTPTSASLYLSEFPIEVKGHPRLQLQSQMPPAAVCITDCLSLSVSFYSQSHMCLLLDVTGCCLQSLVMLCRHCSMSLVTPCHRCSMSLVTPCHRCAMSLVVAQSSDVTSRYNTMSLLLLDSSWLVAAFIAYSI